MTLGRLRCESLPRIHEQMFAFLPVRGYNTCPDVRLADEQDAVWLISMWR